MFSSCGAALKGTRITSKLILLTVKPEQDVTLECRALSDGAVTLLQWNRRDLKDSDYVFFYRNRQAYERYQHPRYRGRVELRDPEMRNGDVSVVLKNVSVTDTGTYNCRVITTVGNETKRLESRQLINLTVTDSDPTSGQEVEHPGHMVGVSVAVGLLVIVLLSSVLCFIMYKRRTVPERILHTNESG
ncbi:hypothetical protein PFLUV_G00170720 [Perca fluviatilis]|uniref:Ig-like domain-containing protein n=1 Tax=Perca fluviatilis TaxID=8168 RepID=A0A6A5EQF5_PERFL|nr:hypothetical protein PFLUV_G00170720 [Perca fluviatilis]